MDTSSAVRVTEKKSPTIAQPGIGDTLLMRHTANVSGSTINVNWVGMSLHLSEVWFAARFQRAIYRKTKFPGRCPGLSSPSPSGCEPELSVSTMAASERNAAGRSPVVVGAALFAPQVPCWIAQGNALGTRTISGMAPCKGAANAPCRPEITRRRAGRNGRGGQNNDERADKGSDHGVFPPVCRTLGI